MKQARVYLVTKRYSAGPKNKEVLGAYLTLKAAASNADDLTLAKGQLGITFEVYSFQLPSELDVRKVYTGLPRSAAAKREDSHTELLAMTIRDTACDWEELVLLREELTALDYKEVMDEFAERQLYMEDRFEFKLWAFPTGALAPEGFMVPILTGRGQRKTLGS